MVLRHFEIESSVLPQGLLRQPLATIKEARVMLFSVHHKEISAVTSFISPEALGCISAKKKKIDHPLYSVTAEYHRKLVTCLEAEGQESISMAGCEE